VEIEHQWHPWGMIPVRGKGLTAEKGIARPMENDTADWGDYKILREGAQGRK